MGRRMSSHRVGSKKERVKCAQCRARHIPGQAMSIHLAKSHDIRSKRYLDYVRRKA